MLFLFWLNCFSVRRGHKKLWIGTPQTAQQYCFKTNFLRWYTYRMSGAKSKARNVDKCIHIVFAYFSTETSLSGTFATSFTSMCCPLLGKYVAASTIYTFKGVRLETGKIKADWWSCSELLSIVHRDALVKINVLRNEYFCGVSHQNWVIFPPTSFKKYFFINFGTNFSFLQLFLEYTVHKSPVF